MLLMSLTIFNCLIMFYFVLVYSLMNLSLLDQSLEGNKKPMRLLSQSKKLSLEWSLMAWCISSSFYALLDRAFTLMSYRGSALKSFSFFVLAIKSFFAAFKTKLYSEIGNKKNPKRIIMTFVIPPSLPSKSNQPKIFLEWWTTPCYS